MRSLLFSLVLLMSTSLIAQNTNTTLSDDPNWAALMQDPNVDYYELIRLFDEKWENREVTPGCGYKPFKRWEWLMRTRVDENGHKRPVQEVVRQWEQINAYMSQRSPSGNWQQLGPILDDYTTRDNIPGIGRMNFVAFHPNDPAIIFAGAPSGGLWRSYDGGENWVSNTDNLPTLGVSAIAFDPLNPDVVYIGTGDRDANDAEGMGIMKSFDGGLSWEFFNEGIENRVVGDILIHGPDPNIIVIATDNGLFRTTDGGVSWNQESGNNNYKDLDRHPTNPDIMYAATGGTLGSQGKFYRSENAGESWSYITNGINPGTRMVIATTPADPDRVYVLRSTTYAFTALYRSLDGGISFETMSTEPNILGWSVDGSGSGGQAWYDLCMEADDFDADRLYVGGIRMKLSEDGGATWSDINADHLHVDQHHCATSPHNHDLYLANDGGMYRYVDNQEWLDISKGIVTGQIYNLGQSMHHPQKVLSGYQDNGTMEYLGTSWARRGGGDGFECFYDPTDPEWYYNSIYYGQVYRNGPFGNNQKIAGENFNQITESGAWEAPFALAPHDENTMFLGMKNMWRARNIKEENRDSILWEKISNDVGAGDQTNFRVIELSRADSNLLFAAEGNRRFYRTRNALAEVPEWEEFSNSLPLQNLPVVDIESHPTDTNRVWMSFDKRIYESNDMGESWVDISGTLPEVDINSIVYCDWALDGLYIGTDMGIYYKDAALEDWVPFSDGFPLSVRVTELEIYYGETIADSRIRAATYGRGVWESDLYDSETFYFAPQADILNANGGNEIFGDGEFLIGFYKNLNYVSVTGFDESDIYVEGAEIESLTGGPDVYTLTLAPGDAGLIKIYVENEAAIDENGMLSYPSDTSRFVRSPMPEPLGYEGPGGVGNLDEEVVLWLKADEGTFENEGGTISNSSQQSVGFWANKANTEAQARSQNDGFPPRLLLEDEGINGQRAIDFNGFDEYLLGEDVPTGRNFSFFGVLQAEGEQFNEHGWMASAREANGFMMHPWKDDIDFSSNAYDNEGGENMGRRIAVEDVSAPHIYATILDDNGVYKNLATIVDENIRWDDKEIGRDESDVINIRFGRDLNDRWGAGKAGELIKYNVRTFSSHYKIVANYLASRYSIDLGANDLFHNDEIYKYELAGIGQELFFDKHEDAKGDGPVRISEPTALNDGEYLLWAHDGTEMVLSDGNAPFLSTTITRTWSYESTGNVGEVRFRFYDENNMLDGGDSFGLIVSDTEEFEFGSEVEFYPLTEEEPGVYVAFVTFEGEGLFTIGADPVVGVSENFADSWSIYPNPVENDLFINARGESVEFELRNELGQLIYSGNVNSNRRVDVSSLASGTYFVTLVNDKETRTLSFIKN